MIRIAVKLDENSCAPYRRAIQRMRGVEPVDDEPADAMITDSPSTAADCPVPCLLHSPQACSIEELRPLLGRRVMPAHDWRFRPDFVPIQRSLASGELGEPALLRIHAWHSSHHPRCPDAFPPVDLAHWLFSSRPDRTFALARPGYLQVHLGFPGGGMALLVAAHRVDADYSSLHLIGSCGAAYADDHHNKDFFSNTDGREVDVCDAPIDPATERMLEEFVNGLREERPCSVGVEDTIAALTTLQEADDA